MASGNAGALLAEHTALMDEILTELYVNAGKGFSGLTLVATGGYGRRELFPYSDIDILFLYAKGQEKTAARVVQAILYPLWDMDLKIGHALRSVDQTIELALTDMTIRTNLLDARFIAGNETSFRTFTTRFSKNIIAGSALKFVEAKLEERDSRHKRFGDSRYMLEPNVKEGKGGLRDLHTVWWLARYSYSIVSLKDLVAAGRLEPEEYERYTQAQDFLWRVRAHLHYLAGHAEERLTFDHQQALAVAMGYGHPSANRAITRFMRRYFITMRTVGAMTRIVCALLEDEKKRKPRKPFAWFRYTPRVLKDFALDGERLAARREEDFARHPLMMVELFHAAQQHDLDIHPRTLYWLTKQLHRLTRDVVESPKASRLFLDILLSKKSAELTLRRMSEAGVLGKLIPDFGRVIGQTQFNMYHVYTVDEHTLVAIGILHAIENGQMKQDLPLASDIIHRLQMRRVLYLALFCHDIAKGRGGDHSALGEKIAMRLAKRLGFTEAETETTAWLVRHHLLMSNTAFKRDVNDPKTIADFVAAVRSPERLKLLLVLTVADMRAVASSVWNAWKGALLRDLYARAEQAMGAGVVTVTSEHMKWLAQELKRRLPGISPAEIEAYFEQGTPGFFTSCPPAQHVVMMRMLKETYAMEDPLFIDTQHDYAKRSSEIMICTKDRKGLFSLLAGAIALSGANIINARIFTLKNGIAIDIFELQDASADVFDKPDKLAKMSVYIEQALSGQLDLVKAFAKRHGKFASARHRAVSQPGHVLVENNASNVCTVIEITGHDRSGFLYQVTHAISELGLSIATAHISTYGTQISDVFYVKDTFGMKVEHDTKIQQIEETLLKIVNNPIRVAQTEP